MTSYLPDVNVLVALSLGKHPHARAATAWYEGEHRPCLELCRIVQLGFLRVLTTQSAAGAGTLTNRAAWILHSRLVEQGFIRFCNEPASLDMLLAERTSTNRSSPKRWNDAYLSAFAQTAGLTLVTFDVALAGYTPRSVLLQGGL